MGNRAVITTKAKDIGIYVHWNGGIDSVTAFLTYCKMRKFRPFPDDYGIARLTQVIANYFGGDLSIGLLTKDVIDGTAENADNGVYIVDGWDIVEHLVPHYAFDEDSDEYSTDMVSVVNNEDHEGYNILDMIIEIDFVQPVGDRLGEDFIRQHWKD